MKTIQAKIITMQKEKRKLEESIEQYEILTNKYGHVVSYLTHLPEKTLVKASELIPLLPKDTSCPLIQAGGILNLLSKVYPNDVIKTHNAQSCGFLITAHLEED